MNPTLPDEEWIKPGDAITWIAVRAGLALDNMQGEHEGLLRKWRIRSTSLAHPLEQIFRIRAGAKKPLFWDVGDHEHEMKVAAEIEAERGLGPAVLLDELKADMWNAWRADAGWNWAERQLLASLRDGRVRARGKPLPPNSRREDVPLGDCAQPVPRTAFYEPAGFDLIGDCLTLRLDGDEDLANWRGPDWWEIRVSRADVLFIFPPAKPKADHDVLNATSWTLLEALAWIVTRDAEAVRNAEAVGAMIFQTVAIPGGRPMLELVPGQGPSMLRINMEIASRHLQNQPPAYELSVYAAGRRLKKILALDRLAAHGRRHGRGDPERVPTQDWDFLEFADVRGHACARPIAEGAGGTVWHDLRFPVESILSEFPAQGMKPQGARNTSWKSLDKARPLYAARVADHRRRNDGERPTLKQDREWSSENRVRREDLRKLREEFAVGDERKGGRRSGPSAIEHGKASPAAGRKLRAK